MSKKISSLLCLLISVMLLVTAMPVSAGFYGSDEVNAMVFDFESDADYAKVLTRAKYELVEGIGADGSNGSLKVSVNDNAGLNTFTGGVVSEKPILKNGVTYRISYKVMADASTVGATFKTAFIADNASGTYTDIGGKTDVAVGDAFTGAGPWWMHDAKTIPCDGTWHTYVQEFTMGDDVFGLGSSSKVAITSYDAIHFYLRYYAETDNGLYVDDIIVEPVSSTGVTRTLTLGNEVMGTTAPTGIYNAYFVNDAKLMKRTGYSVQGFDGGNDVLTHRAVANTAGKDGGYAFVGAFSPKDGAGSLGFGNSAYNFSGIKPNGLYEVRIRAMAPKVTVDTNKEKVSGEYRIDQNGNVYVSDSNTKNGLIGASLGFEIATAGKTFKGAFSGRLYGNGGYNPEPDEAKLKASDWLTYYGYVYIDHKTDFTVESSDQLRLTFTGATGNGLLMVDQFSIKPVNEENLVANGWLKATAKKRIFINSEKGEAPFVFVNPVDTTNPLYAKMSNGCFTIMDDGASKEYTLGVKKLEAGKQYALNAAVMSDGGKTNAVTLSLTNGTATQTITPAPVVFDNNGWKQLSYIFTPSAELLGDGTVSPDLKINVGPASEGTSGSFRIQYAEIVEPAYTASNVAVSGDLEVGKDITVSWTDASALGAADGYLVKTYCNGALIGSTATATTSASITVPAQAYGKALSFEVVAYKDHVAYYTVGYTTTGTVSGTIIEISDTALAEGRYSANVKYVGEDDAFAIIATYADDTSMVLVDTAVLTSGEVTPISISAEGAVKAKVFVFAGTGFADTEVTPLCEDVEF